MARKSSGVRRRMRKYRGLRKVYKSGGRKGVRPYAKATHWFKESCQIASLSAAAGGFAGQLMTFKLNDLNNAASFKALFDLYKLTGVKVKIVPKFNVSDPTSVANHNTQAGTLPMLYIAPNRDPYVPAPINAADILNDDGCRIIRLTRPINLYLKAPKAQVTTGGGDQVPMSWGVGSKWQPWLTTGGNGQSIDQSGIEHFGYRTLIENGVGNFDVVLDVYATYYFAMKEQD